MPLFYERTEGPTPRGWVRRMKSSLRSLGPQVTAARMVRDYVTELYEPTAAHGPSQRGRHAAAKELAAWKARVNAAWSGVHVVDVRPTPPRPTSARPARSRRRSCSATSHRRRHRPAPARPGRPGRRARRRGARHDDPRRTHGHETRYRGELTCATAGRYGFTVRVVPSHPDLAQPVELGKVAWA